MTTGGSPNYRSPSAKFGGGNNLSTRLNVLAPPVRYSVNVGGMVRASIEDDVAHYHDNVGEYSGRRFLTAALVMSVDLIARSIFSS